VNKKAFAIIKVVVWERWPAACKPVLIISNLPCATAAKCIRTRVEQEVRVSRRTGTDVERRVNRRYDIRLPLHYRVSEDGHPPRSGTGMTYDLSTYGVGFHCRRPLPVGARIFMSIAWPTKYQDVHPIDLLVTGSVVRSESGRTAVRVTSRKFRTDFMAAGATYQRASA
jgi:hypothetical protein